MSRSRRHTPENLGEIPLSPPLLEAAGQVVKMWAEKAGGTQVGAA